MRSGWKRASPPSCAPSPDRGGTPLMHGAEPQFPPVSDTGGAPTPNPLPRQPVGAGLAPPASSRPSCTGERPRVGAHQSCADVLLICRVATLDPAWPTAEAVAVAGGTILAVGD